MGMDLTAKSYQPVSNLPFLAKVIESVALDQMNAHSDEHKVIPDYQSAYHANYSCEDCIGKIGQWHFMVIQKARRITNRHT